VVKLVIVAQYKEDVTWSNELPNEWVATVLTKDVHLPNVGREPSTFLYHIIQNYINIKAEDEFVFVQGNPFDHYPDLIQFLSGETPSDTYVSLGRHMYACDGNGNPHDGGLPVKILYEQWFGWPFPGSVNFVAGGQFYVRGDAILSKSLEFYQKLYEDVQLGRHCYVFERLWESIFRYTETGAQQ
jgi:hypothetical protein